MIIDPYGEIMAECRDLENSFAIAELTRDKLINAGGFRYINARRPDLYRDILSEPHHSEQKVIWYH